MQPRLWTFHAVFGLALLVRSSLAGELPNLTTHGPAPEDRLAKASSIVVGGHISPTFKTHVNIQVFQVLEDGGLIRQFGCSLDPREDGKFSVTVEPPFTSWLPGKSRMRVSLSRLPQVFTEMDFTVVGDPVVLPNVTPMYFPKASGLVIKLPLDEVKVYDMPPKATCLVEGQFRSKRDFDGIEGPPLHGSLVITRDDATRVTYDDYVAPTFKQEDGSYWFQLQLKSPEKPGLYHMKLKSIIPDVVPPDAFGPSELPFSIRVVEPAEAKRP